MRQGWLNLMGSVSLIALHAAVNWPEDKSVVGRRSSVDKSGSRQSAVGSRRAGQ